MPRDAYATRAYTWWHLSRTPPELTEALRRSDAPHGGRALDLGCGLGTEVAAVDRCGFRGVGIDRSRPALLRARALHPRSEFLQADVRALPFAGRAFDLLLDRGCFHYLRANDRIRYAQEAARVLRPGGRFLLRASTQSRGVSNDIDEPLVRRAFAGWRIFSLDARRIPSDTRALASLVVWLGPPPRSRRARPRAKYEPLRRTSARLDRGVGRPLTHRNRP